MTGRVHETRSNAGEQATKHPPIEIGNYASPACLRWAEATDRAARPPADTFTLPTTAVELDAMSYADRVRVYNEGQVLYDRLAGRAPAA
ncbi:hypothetical protein [Streptomyces atratus]|uniref:hypothetical protein n=1 Tax=Streptomyces atratus TaxID=1893 RepID=UPI0033FD5E85